MPKSYNYNIEELLDALLRDQKRQSANPVDTSADYDFGGRKGGADAEYNKSSAVPVDQDMSSTLGYWGGNEYAPWRVGLGYREFGENRQSLDPELYSKIIDMILRGRRRG